jgi:hypothetical protein
MAWSSSSLNSLSPNTSRGSISSSSCMDAMTPADAAVYNTHPLYPARSRVFSPLPRLPRWWFLHSHSVSRFCAIDARCPRLLAPRQPCSRRATLLPRLARAATTCNMLEFGCSGKSQDTCEGRIVSSFHLLGPICFIF